MRLVNYCVYNIIVPLFIVLMSIFLYVDTVNGSGGTLKYIISFFIFGTFIAGSTFFNRKFSYFFHPASFLFVVIGFVFLFTAAKELKRFTEAEEAIKMNLNYPFYLLVIVDAMYLLLLRTDKKVLRVVGVGNLILAGSAFILYKKYSSSLAFLIMMLTSVVISVIIAILCYDFESEDCWLVW